MSGESPDFVCEMWKLLLALIGRGVKQERELAVLVNVHTTKMAIPILFDICAAFADIARPDISTFKKLLCFGMLCETTREEVVAASATVFIQGLIGVYLKEEGESIDMLGSFDEDDCCDIVFAPDTDDYGQSKNIVMYASPAKLVQRLTVHNPHDIAYQQDFFTTYRTFVSPNQLLKLLVRLWGPPVADKESSDLRVMRLRLGSALNFWVEKHFEDFCPWSLSILWEFLNKQMSLQHKATQEKIFRVRVGRGVLEQFYVKALVTCR